PEVSNQRIRDFWGVKRNKGECVMAETNTTKGAAWAKNAAVLAAMTLVGLCGYAVWGPEAESPPPPGGGRGPSGYGGAGPDCRRALASG
ncbi:hypothetical protein MK280_07330, partial [Myxococcota bacterium]|nr:hypothetical protein [Myxococcota bacterium]